MTSQRLDVYDLNNSYYLYEDIEVVLEQVSEIYKIEFSPDKNIYYPIITVSKEHNWVSNEVTAEFNKMVPKMKSIIKDMYSLIEGIYKYKHGKFKKFLLEEENPLLMELRLLNNKFKHHESRIAKIQLTQISNLSENGTILDCFIRFDFIKTERVVLIRFADLVNVFIKILEKEDIIIIDRK